MSATAWTLLAIAAVVVWPISSAISWFIVRATSAPDLRRRYAWNWRLLLGPWPYLRWLDRRHR